MTYPRISQIDKRTNPEHLFERYRRLYHATLTLMFLFAVAFFTITTAFVYFKFFFGEQATICQTQACIKASNRILENLDPTTDPCEDFSQFSCGSFIKTQRIPPEQSKYDVFDILNTKLGNYVSDALASDISSRDIEATVKAKTLYRSCMNEEQINQKGEENFIQILEEYFGGWPILNQPNQNLTIIKRLLKLRRFGFKPLIDIRVSPNPKMPNANVLKLKQPNWLFAKQYYEEEMFASAYMEYLRKFVVYLNPGLEGRVDKEVARIFELERRIARLQFDGNKKAKEYQNMTIRSLSEQIPKFQWKEFIVDGIFKSMVNMTISEDEPIIVYDIEFVSDICDLLTDTTIPKSDIDNLVIWSAISKEVLFLPKKYKDAKLEFDEVYRGRKTEEPRDQTCAFLTLGAMEYAVGRLYVLDNFDKRSKQATTEMVDVIREEFIEILRETEWLDEKSKSLALDKASFIKSNIGYPDFIYNDTYMNKLYENFELNETEYLRNSLHILELDVLNAFGQLRQTKVDDWITGPAIVNAFYSSYSNQICLPAGILQAPFYDANYPNYLNYGGIGSVIGHEITHGFDERGRLHDKNGVLYPDNETSLWSKKTIENYNEKVQCIIDQYSKFVVGQINQTLNGVNTLGENIADNGGLKEAFRSYKKWVAKNGAEQLLPGLKYNQEQLFFINNAQIWCAKSRDQYLKYQVLSANHSPGQFRINGPTSNSKEFAEVFQCKPDQKNNPAKKCSVW